MALLGIYPLEAWDELPEEVKRKIGSVAIATVLADAVIKDAPEEGKWIGEDLRRKCRAELRRHVTDAGIRDSWPFCWSFLSDGEREAL